MAVWWDEIKSSSLTSNLVGAEMQTIQNLGVWVFVKQKDKDWQDMGAAWVTTCYFCMFTFTTYPITEIDSRWEKHFVIRAESPWTSPLFAGRDLFQFADKLEHSELQHFLYLGKSEPGFSWEFYLPPYSGRLLKMKTALLCFGVDWSNFYVMFK